MLDKNVTRAIHCIKTGPIFQWLCLMAYRKDFEYVFLVQCMLLLYYMLYYVLDVIMFCYVEIIILCFRCSVF